MSVNATGIFNVLLKKFSGMQLQAVATQMILISRIYSLVNSLLVLVKIIPVIINNNKKILYNVSV